ncbi:MAG: hypothetical protein IJH07_05460 [Ruminococcus sp.]|nr:hypothetical protein [Ruminococcus sp.]
MNITTNVDTVIAQLRQYRDKLNERIHTMLQRLAAIGVDTADVAFKTAQYDGDNDVVVNAPEWISDTQLIISATGSAVTFIEFGSGVHYVKQHPKAVQLGAIRGGYGKGRGKRDTWGYYGNPGTNGRTVPGKAGLVLTHGNPPARAMYDAGKEMRERVTEIAREVFAHG